MGIGIGLLVIPITETGKQVNGSVSGGESNITMITRALRLEWKTFTIFNESCRSVNFGGLQSRGIMPGARPKHWLINSEGVESMKDQTYTPRTR